MLSAQCTDARVNLISPALFARFPTPEAFAQAKLKEIEQFIRSVSYFRTKARAIQESCKRLLDEFQGKVPENFEGLISLRGVGRKTANVILGVAFRKPAIVVDTHVKRLSYRLGLSESQNPDIIEKDLAQSIPKEDWIDLAHWMIAHGRKVCKARKPLCRECKLESACLKRGVSTTQNG